MSKKRLNFGVKRLEQHLTGSGTRCYTACPKAVKKIEMRATSKIGHQEFMEMKLRGKGHKIRWMIFVDD